MAPWTRALFALIVLGLSACGGADPLPSVPGEPRDPAQAQLHFVTDRAEADARQDMLLLTARRDPAMHYGVAALRGTASGPEIAHAETLLSFPATPLPLIEDGVGFQTDPATAAQYDEAGRAMQETLAEALRASGQGDILLYIHGYNSNFVHSLETLGVLWGATGRNAVPLAYSWPAGNPGLFGYFKDRESGEFTIFHLKQTLRLLAGVPGLDRIHIIAHSRGSDVAATALRELVIESRAAGRDPRDVYRIENLILAAPDLDFSVVRQRLIAEQFGTAFGRITVYMNPGDGALGLAQVLMAGTRFGRLSFEQLGDRERAIFQQIRNVHFVNVSAVTGASSHTYFSENPEVLEDMVEIIATDALPDDPRRNLIHEEANFWRLVLPEDTEPPFERDPP